MKQDLSSQDNSVIIISDVIKTLQVKKPFSLFSKAFCLRLLVHIVGDMHQPLHNLALYSKTFPKSDFGGNEIKVTMNVDKSKLK